VLFSLPIANADNGNQAKFTPLANDGGYEIAWSNAIDRKATPVYSIELFHAIAITKTQITLIELARSLE
jgi:hypothetical protein